MVKTQEQAMMKDYMHEIGIIIILGSGFFAALFMLQPRKARQTVRRYGVLCVE